MSHVIKIRTVLKDIDAVEATCQELGLTFKRNQKTYAWWGRSVGDYPLPAGFTVADLGKCEHAIGVPGTSWEIGVVKLKDGTGYTLLFDFFGSQGRPLLEAIGGKEAQKFTQLYGVNVVTRQQRALGRCVVRQVQPNGVVRLQVTGRM